MGRVVHFEIHAIAPEEAARFYSAIFGWDIAKWRGPIPYWLISTGETGPGIDGGIVPSKEDALASIAAVNAYVCTVAVESLDETLAAVKNHGGTVVVEKHEVPGVGVLAHFKDPDGNIFGALQPLVSTGEDS